MLQKLLHLLESASFKAVARRGNLTCPSCRSSPAAMPVAPDEVIACAHCGTAASALEWSSRASAAIPDFIGDPDRPPASTRITRQADSGAMVWRIPASGKSGGFMFFAVFWCTITAIVSGGFLLSTKRPDDGGFENAWFVAFFFGLFWAVGLGMLYVACRTKYAKHRLSVDRSTVTLRRDLFGRSTEMKLPRDSVKVISAVEFYQRNYRPVYGIEIRGSHGKLRFGSMLTADEQAWLIADLKRAVLGEATPPVTAANVRGAPDTRSFFSVELPPSPKLLLGPGLMFAIMGTVSLCIGMFVIGKVFYRNGNGGPSMLDPFFSYFRVMWLFGSSVLTLIGIALLVRHARTRRNKVHLDGTDGEVTLRTTQFGRILHQRAFPRAEVIDVRASTCGHHNGKPMQRIELLVGKKAHRLANWVDPEKADAFVAKVRRALFHAPTH